jgi:demethylmenaquinone methyltransferase/2-methoxy-6-polyprenyl-1,4-benzoquinol methylase
MTPANKIEKPTFPFMPDNSKKQFVRQMFDEIQGKYDFLNTILSFGQDNRWRKKAIREMPNEGIIVDLCGGGGQMANHLLAIKDFVGAIVIADISKNMLAQSRTLIDSKYSGRYFPVVCDAEKLPFKNCSFSGGMSAFSLRNLTDLEAFSRETLRAIQPNGIARFLEIAHPENKFISPLFNFYFYRLSPIIARLFGAEKYAYKYLPQSLKIFPDQKNVVKILSVGWRKSNYKNLFGGMAAIYTLSKASDD